MTRKGFERAVQLRDGGEVGHKKCVLNSGSSRARVDM